MSELRKMAREAMTASEAAVDREDMGHAIVHLLRAMRLLEQAHEDHAPRLAQATTRELLQEVHRRCERDDMHASIVRTKVSSLLSLLPAGSVLDQADPYR